MARESWPLTPKSTVLGLRSASFSLHPDFTGTGSGLSESWRTFYPPIKVSLGHFHQQLHPTTAPLLDLEVCPVCTQVNRPRNGDSYRLADWKLAVWKGNSRVLRIQSMVVGISRCLFFTWREALLKELGLGRWRALLLGFMGSMYKIDLLQEDISLRKWILATVSADWGTTRQGTPCFVMLNEDRWLAAMVLSSIVTLLGNDPSWLHS